MKGLLKLLLPLADVIAAPIVYPAALLLKLIRMAGVHRMPFCKKALLQVGVFPIRNHYFEPLFDCKSLRTPLGGERNLLGINWDVTEQLNLLQSFRFNDELAGMLSLEPGEFSFRYENSSFGAGDADFLYNLIRHKRPARIIEIGSGNSTLMARQAINKNREEIPGYTCDHVCIEPYEISWLEKTGVTVIRERVEDVGLAFFSLLEKNDILFIDSSHVIRPQGDVLFEYLELLPTLNVGVIVHIHDIFTPRDYPKEWICGEVRLWNEQYLLEAFLTGNHDWKIIGALNYLHHNHFEKLRETCVCLTHDLEPGSFYMQKVC
jgi:hypothetical protein